MILIVANEDKELIKNIMPEESEIMFCDNSFEVLQLLKKGINASVSNY